MKRLLCTIGLILNCGCAPELYYTEFRPIKTENGFQYFVYKVRTNAFQHANNAEREKERISCLEEWFTLNGYSNTEYEIISRIPLLKQKTIETYDIYYNVKVPIK